MHTFQYLFATLLVPPIIWHSFTARRIQLWSQAVSAFLFDTLCQVLDDVIQLFDLRILNFFVVILELFNVGLYILKILFHCVGDLAVGVWHFRHAVVDVGGVVLG